MTSVTLLIPTRNEAVSLLSLFDSIGQLNFKPEVLIADYKSTDGTKEIALERGARLFCIAQRGKGSAIREAIPYIETQYTITLDADGTYPVHFCEDILKELSKIDIVIGSRTWKHKGSMSSVNSFGNWCLNILATILFLRRIKDINSGMWGFKTELLKSFNLSSKEFTIEADYFVNCAKKKVKITEIPIDYLPRVTGSKSKLMILDGFKIAWFLIRKRWTKNS